ncbi:MAG: glutamate--tRNA ligase [bacterium]
MNEMVRVRFAPSPTGHLHVGNARTAILNWLFARHCGGQFILRIEDTDAERSTQESEGSILEDLRWLGLDWDEGPTGGGAYGPYRQSERRDIYRQYVEQLQQRGSVYPCYCTEAELQQKREEALARGETPKYDRKCLSLTEAQRRAFEQEERKPVWRFRVQPGAIEWYDLVKGELSFDAGNLGDFVVLRSDGLATYNFAATVDDALMQITQVIRGDDHVSNTPKQILIYNALGWPPPQFCHVPMILGPDRTRLSKRHGATSIDEFRTQGYLPQALVNFLSLLSWSSESGEEILSVEQLIREIDLKRISKSPAIFDVVKLNWMNGLYIRALPADELVELAIPFLKHSKADLSDRKGLTSAISLVKDSLEYLSQIPELVEPFYRERVYPSDGQAIAWSSKDSSQKVYWAFLRNLKNYNYMDAEIFRDIMKQVQQETGLMGKELWVPVRVALTGKIHGPDLPRVAEILGKEKCERFVQNLTD